MLGTLTKAWRSRSQRAGWRPRVRPGLLCPRAGQCGARLSAAALRAHRSMPDHSGHVADPDDVGAWWPAARRLRPARHVGGRKPRRERCRRVRSPSRCRRRFHASRAGSSPAPACDGQGAGPEDGRQRRRFSAEHAVPTCVLAEHPRPWLDRRADDRMWLPGTRPPAALTTAGRCSEVPWCRWWCSIRWRGRASRPARTTTLARPAAGSSITPWAAPRYFQAWNLSQPSR